VIRRLVTLVIIASLGIPTGSPARGQEADYQPPQFIQLFVWHEGPASELGPIQSLVTQYNATHAAYRIVVNQQPPSVAYQRLQAWSGPERRTAPDMVIVPDAWLLEFKNMLRSLETALSAPQRAVFYPEVIDLFTADGRLRAVPWRIGGRGLVVRADLLEEADLPTPETWEDVLKAAKTFHKPPDIYGIGLPAGQDAGQMLAEMIWAFGGSIGTKERYTLATDAGTNALQFLGQLAEFAQPQTLTWSQPELEALFANGRLAMLVTDTWWLQQVAGQQDLNLKMQMLNLPAQEQSVAHLMGEGLAIINGSSYEAQCLEFVRMICQPDSQAKLLELGGLPSGPECGKTDEQQCLYAALAKNIGAARQLPGLDRVRILNALQLGVYLSLSGRGTASAALEEAEHLVASSQ